MANDSIHQLRAEHEAFLLLHTRRLLNSYQRWTGRDLLSPTDASNEMVKALFEASFPVVSHGTEADPVFNYGNRTALRLFEMDWDQFTRTPSRKSAEPDHRDERRRMLEEVTAKGYTDSYQGIRITAGGRRFHILRATVWNLLDEDGAHCGQAATFSQWKFL